MTGITKNVASTIEYPCSEQRYFDDDGLNASTIKRCVAGLNPLQINIGKGLISDIKQSAAMSLGSAVHTLVLEGEKVYRARYAVEPAVDRRTKAGKAELAAWLLDSGNKKPIKPDIDAQAHAIALAVRDCTDAAPYLKNGEAEHAYFWIDRDTGVPCKARIDYTKDGKVVDLKTCTDASSFGFNSSVGKFRYHVQAAWYLRAYRECTGHEPEQFIFVAVESKAPHSVGVYELDQETLEAADSICSIALRLFARYLVSGEVDTNYGSLQTIGLRPSMLHTSAVNV